MKPIRKILGISFPFRLSSVVRLPNDSTQQMPDAEELKTVVQDYLKDNPPAPGTSVTKTDVENAVSDYLAANPPAPGKNASEADIGAAVASYLKANPPAPGKNADPPTAAQLGAAVASYLQANPVQPAPPLAPTSAQISAAVSAYLTANPPPKGKDGTVVTPVRRRVQTNAAGDVTVQWPVGTFAVGTVPVITLATEEPDALYVYRAALVGTPTATGCVVKVSRSKRSNVTVLNLSVTLWEPVTSAVWVHVTASVPE